MKKKYTILIVDDDADDREITRDAFETLDGQNEYIFIDNGEKLMEYLENNNQNNLPSLILLDLNMPGKDGREALKEIKESELYQHTPTIVFSTSSSQRDKNTSYALGANCFITKPDTFNKLVDLMSAIKKLWMPES